MKRKAKKFKPIKTITSTEQCCVDIEMPEGYGFITSGDCAVVEQDGRTILVAPFGCLIHNTTNLHSNFGPFSVFNPFAYPTLRSVKD
jgi:hypothetical protein